jgi:RNA polymerase sigma factor for flagellar operon FliA
MTEITSRLAAYARARADAGEERLIEGLGRQEILATYSKKVAFIARRIAHRLPRHAPIELDDLINSGALGLLDAIEKFDPEKQASFSTYAEFRIRGAILDLLRGLDPVSRTVREKAHELERVTRDLELKLRRPPESEEVAREMHLPLAEYYELLHEVRSIHLVSLDVPRGGEDGTPGLAETLEDMRQERPDQEFDRRESQRILAEAIEHHLPERLRHILVMYYHREMSLKEIGEVLSLTESRVSQLHTEACLRLRARLAERLRPGERIDAKVGRASKF